MSKQSADEIEEGEIYESDSDMEIQDVNDGEDEEDFDVAELMTSLFATENGDTVCTALVGISSQLQVQNKILVKILAQLNSSKTN
jgi:hypothetical protein|tara:strand:- start:3373 stop:3627 length:255 start_codon:yes stop_codon:yes gene_type:complete